MNGSPDLKSWMVGALMGKWGMDNLTNNAASVHLETDILTFIKLPDGSFALPPGTTSNLVLIGNQYRVDERFSRTINFDSSNNVSSMTDADGNAVNFTYSGGLLQSVNDNFGHTLTFHYTGSLLTSVTDSAGRGVSYSYTGNDLTTYTDPEGKVWTYGPDNTHRILTLKNPLNITTVTNVYDTFGQVQSQTLPRQTGSTTYNLYFSGYRNIEEDGAGHDIIYYFDDQKHLLGVENALGQRNIKSYDGQGHVVSETDPRVNTTGYAYDGNNNPTRITDPYGKQTINTYDGQYHLTDVLDPLGHLKHTDYNTTHHPTRITVYPVSTQPVYSQKSYYANGLVNTSTDARNVVTTLTQDGYGNPATSKTSTAPTITYGYDAVGRMTSLTDQVGSKTTFSYNNRSLLTGSTDPLNKSVSLTYYDDGTLHTVTDRNNKTTTSWINARDRVASGKSQSRWQSG
jgi:YD repeat-containing protein